MHKHIKYSPDFLADSISPRCRLLLFGESGIGKSTLAIDLARLFVEEGRSCMCIGADPGLPAFGLPGAVSLGRWHDGDWQVVALEALCTLDAGRFRLPLVSAVRRLAGRVSEGLVLVDAPGIVRSVAGAELLAGLVEAASIDTILVLCRDSDKLPLKNELATSGCEVIYMQPSGKARRPRKRQRALHRTRLWDNYLCNTREKSIAVPRHLVTGTPPPPGATHDWKGRQIAFLKNNRTIGMGEILNIKQNLFRIRIGDIREQVDQYLVRDARRNEQGRLETFKPTGSRFLQFIPPPDVAAYPALAINTGPRPVVRVGDVTAVLVNGVFGDPLIHLRLHNRKRSLLFDLGEGGRLPARLAHQVTDVFISHAHFDHIAGFLWLLRSRIGIPHPCRIFGGPGLSDNIFNLINGIRWDRIGDSGPRFEVNEFHADHIVEYGLQAGKEEKTQLSERPAPNGLLLIDQDCKVRASTLDHGALPVLAYCLELVPKLNVRQDRLLERNLPSGPWLGELKKHLAADDEQAVIRLPDGSSSTVGSLAEEMIRITPARKIVYATDLSESPPNLEKLLDLARGAHLFFCEAAFLAQDKKYAELSGHLTGKGCGKLAAAARVEKLVPFQFSRRYEDRIQQIYDEVKDGCSTAQVEVI